MEPNWEKPPIRPVTAKLYLQIVSAHYNRQGWYHTLFTNNYWKDDATPCFVSYYSHYAITPYLTATTGRRLQPPAGLMPALAPPYHLLFLYDLHICFMISLSDFTLVSNYYKFIKLYC